MNKSLTLNCSVGPTGSGCAMVARCGRSLTLSSLFSNSHAASDAAINLDRVIIDRINYCLN